MHAKCASSTLVGVLLLLQLKEALQLQLDSLLYCIHVGKRVAVPSIFLDLVDQLHLPFDSLNLFAHAL